MRSDTATPQADMLVRELASGLLAATHEQPIRDATKLGRRNGKPIPFGTGNHVPLPEGTPHHEKCTAHNGGICICAGLYAVEKKQKGMVSKARRQKRLQARTAARRGTSTWMGKAKAKHKRERAWENGPPVAPLSRKLWED